MDPLPDELDFDCPRCATTVRARVYGPCSDCRSALGALAGPAGGAAPAERFEPRAHVVPNHVATKE